MDVIKLVLILLEYWHTARVILSPMVSTVTNFVFTITSIVGTVTNGVPAIANTTINPAMADVPLLYIYTAKINYFDIRKW